MNKEIFKMSIPINEPILNYSPGSKEKKELKKVLNDFKSKEAVSYTHLTMPTILLV